MAGKRWLRLYVEILNDPKVQRLSPHLFRTWVNLLALAGQNNGRLPGTSDIAFHLRMSTSDASSHIDDLILAELIDVHPDRSMSPHNWDRRQFVSDCGTSSERVRKFRQKRAKSRSEQKACNGDETLHETFHETPVKRFSNEICSESVSESESVSSSSQRKETDSLRGNGTRNGYRVARDGEVG